MSLAQLSPSLFSLFFSVWRNPNIKINSILKYLLETSESNSRTWSIHIKYLAEKYGLMDPLLCLNKCDAPSKSEYKKTVKIKISAYYEKNLRISAENNSRMKYLHVSLSGLNGRRHPALDHLITTHEVQKSRIHLKMLAGDYLTYEVKSNQSGGSPHCRSCNTPSPIENMAHILSLCGAYDDIKKRMLPELESVCAQSKSHLDFSKIKQNNETLCQFLLDPTSFNLQ